jgi:hypothetical protein
LSSAIFPPCNLFLANWPGLKLLHRFVPHQRQLTKLLRESAASTADPGSRHARSRTALTSRLICYRTQFQALTRDTVETDVLKITYWQTYCSHAPHNTALLESGTSANQTWTAIVDGMCVAEPFHVGEGGT